jgi:hypothetical protein
MENDFLQTQNVQFKSNTTITYQNDNHGIVFSLARTKSNQITLTCSSVDDDNLSWKPENILNYD